QNPDTVNETRRKQSFNPDLGLPKEPRGGRLTESHLNACVREYKFGMPREKEVAVGGVAVGDRFHIVLRTRPRRAGDECRLLFAGSVVDVDDVKRILEKYQVRVCVVEALPEKRAIKSLVNAVKRCTVWMAYYPESDYTKRSEPVRWVSKEAAVHV